MPTGVYKRKPFTKERRLNISKSLIGKKLSEIHKLHISISLVGKKSNSPTKFKKDIKSWNIGKNGEESHCWKGDNTTPHHWITREKGKALNYVCEICKAKKAKHWSNKNHKYKNVLEDWQALCVSCHKKFDIKYNKKYVNKKI